MYYQTIDGKYWKEDDINYCDECGKVTDIPTTTHYAGNYIVSS